MDLTNDSEQPRHSGRLAQPPRVALFAVPVALLVATIGYAIANSWYEWFEKRVMVVVPGQLVRGAYQRPKMLRRVIEREKIKTVVTLAEIPTDSERFRDEARVLRNTGTRWIIVPIHDSRPTLEQMLRASDLLADTQSRPVFFHCIAGHHRTSLALAAYRIRHEGWSAEQAWQEAASVPWARPETDRFDHRQIEAFAAQYGRTITRQ